MGVRAEKDVRHAHREISQSMNNVLDTEQCISCESTDNYKNETKKMKTNDKYEQELKRSTRSDRQKRKCWKKAQSREMNETSNSRKESGPF